MTQSELNSSVPDSNETSESDSAKRVKRLLPIDDNDKVAFKRSKSAAQPRWHSQSYMVFLALRQHPERSLPRRELINAALALDKKISAELGLPRVFRGRTPGNSASAILTYNNDRYFIPFKPEGSRSMHFRLAYEPGDVNHAVAEYQKWCKKLAEHDWPYCFGVPKETPLVSTYHTPQSELNELVVPDCNTDGEGDCVLDSKNSSTDQSVQPLPSSPSPSTEENKQQDSPTEETTELKEKELESKKQSSPSIKSKEEELKKKMEEAPVYTLDQLDLTGVPKSWDEVVYVAPSRIPNAGMGLFAKRKIPFNVPVGFYFGVPMTEDEFDSLKDRVGRSSQYSIMYRKTVLDATDDEGEPVTDQSSPRFCPFHFMNETDWKHANVAFVEGAVVNQVICWTRKEIQADEELLVWYGADVNRHWNEEKQQSEDQKATPPVDQQVDKPIAVQKSDPQQVPKDQD
ncbi:hypothetical protein EDC96DRAFT_496906 [Choanephora cucurbitarum]|nr:hypothetical protein EDC96DRAFT_496906 [Choanephora cucurbitarum]